MVNVVNFSLGRDRLLPALGERTWRGATGNNVGDAGASSAFSGQIAQDIIIERGTGRVCLFFLAARHVTTIQIQFMCEV